VIGLAALGLTAGGALPDFWSSVVIYNLVYAGGADRWGRLLQEVGRLGLSGGIALLCGGALYLLGLWAFRVQRPQDSRWGAMRALALVALMDLPLEALMTLASGRLYLQYLTPWFASLAVLIALVTSAIGSARPRLRLERWSNLGLACAAALAVMVTVSRIDARRPEAGQVRLAAAAIRASTDSEESVLIWGAETQVLVLSGRRAPSRYVYLYPLLTVGYGTEERLEEFLQELCASPPALIIDTSATNPVIPPLDPSTRAAWQSSDPQYQPPEAMDSVFSWIAADYTPVTDIGHWHMLVRGQP
jgi:hypothetical protein